jgi:hypothetical protein
VAPLSFTDERDSITGIPRMSGIAVAIEPCV